MWAVWKYRLSLGMNDITMPANSELLHVDQQGSGVCIWARVDPHSCATKCTRRLYLVGTEQEISNPARDDVRHVGTAMDGAFVWHVFDAGEVSVEGF